MELYDLSDPALHVHVDLIGVCDNACRQRCSWTNYALKGALVGKECSALWTGCDTACWYLLFPQTKRGPPLNLGLSHKTKCTKAHRGVLYVTNAEMLSAVSKVTRILYGILNI